MTSRASRTLPWTLTTLLAAASACTLQLPMPWGQDAVLAALGWTAELHGVALEHGRCQIDRATDAAILCAFDQTTCMGGCGAELSAFTDRVDAHNAGISARGGRHILGWTLELRGRISIDWAEPWEFAADRVEVACQDALFRAEGEVERLAGVAVERGQRTLRYPDPGGLHPGDILVGPDGWQVPIRAVCTSDDPCRDAGDRRIAGAFQLGWPWPGPSTDDTYISTGVAVRQSGEAVSFRSVCPIYDATRWSRGRRETPASVIRTPGWDTEDGWCTHNFEHPGDYHHANVSLRPGGGTNGVRYTGCVVQSHGVVNQHAELLRSGYPPEGIGAGFLLLANTVKVETRLLMNAATRCFLVAAGHRIELEGICEGPVQMLWAPGGVSSLLLTGAMNHQNSSAPRDLPWIDLGTTTRRSRTAVNIRFPFVFFQWGAGDPRGTMIRAQGEPIYLHVEAAVRNVDRILDIPDGSVAARDPQRLPRPSHAVAAYTAMTMAPAITSPPRGLKSRSAMPHPGSSGAGAGRSSGASVAAAGTLGAGVGAGSGAAPGGGAGGASFPTQMSTPSGRNVSTLAPVTFRMGNGVTASPMISPACCGEFRLA
jgi:hypothetical protein